MQEAREEAKIHETGGGEREEARCVPVRHEKAGERQGRASERRRKNA